MKAYVLSQWARAADDVETAMVSVVWTRTRFASLNGKLINILYTSLSPVEHHCLHLGA